MASPFGKNILKKAPTPKPTNRPLADTAVGILRQPGLAMIDFQFGGVKVIGSNFAKVAEAIDSGRIKCWTVKEFESQGSDELAPGMLVNARYEEKSNAMVFSSDDFGKNPGEDRTIVHEAVHAAIDLNAPSGTTTKTLSIDDESAAVVAVAFYIRLCDKPVGAFKMEADGPEGPALDLIDRIADRSGPMPTWRGPYAFSAEDIQPIREGTGRKWNFRKFTDKDGLPTDRTGAIYTYDGVPVCGMGCK